MNVIFFDSEICDELKIVYIWENFYEKQISILRTISNDLLETYLKQFFTARLLLICTNQHDKIIIFFFTNSSSGCCMCCFCKLHQSIFQNRNSFQGMLEVIYVSS